MFSTFPSGRKDLALLGDLVLHSAVARRLQRAVPKVRLDAGDRCLRRLQPLIQLRPTSAFAASIAEFAAATWA